MTPRFVFSPLTDLSVHKFISRMGYCWRCERRTRHTLTIRGYWQCIECSSNVQTKPVR